MALSPGHFLLLTILSLLLTFVCVAQAFPFINGYETFIRSLELLFVGVFLVHTARSRQALAVRLSTGGWLFLGWLVAASISVALSSHVVPSLFRHAELLMHILFGFTLWHYLRHDPAPLQWILLLIPLGFFLTGLFLLSFWFSLSDPHAYDWFDLIPLFGHVRHFGYYGLAGLVFSATPLLGFGPKTVRQRRILAFAALSICWGFLFFTGGRAAVGSGVIALLPFIWFAGRGQRAWAAGLVLAAAGVGLLLSSFFWVEHPYLGFVTMLERTADAAAAQSINGVSTGRLSIWSIALQGVEGHLWFGLGPDGYRYLPQPHHGVQPHSMLVQFIVEWGVVGSVLFVSLLFVVFRTAYRRLREEQDPLRKTARVAACALILGATLHGLVSGLYYHAQPLLFLYLCFAIALLPTRPLPYSDVRHPIFRHLTSRRTLCIATVLLALLFILNSDLPYRLLQAWGG